MTRTWNVPDLPFALTPSPEASWTITQEPFAVVASAVPHSDMFIDPGGYTQLNAESLTNAATLLGIPPEGDFQLSARVTVDFASTYDAGVLLLWIDERHWGELCFEFSPAREPMIVSVVTRGVSCVPQLREVLVHDRRRWCWSGARNLVHKPETPSNTTALTNMA